MADPAHVLVVAATARELAAPAAWRALQCGVGPVEAAASVAAAIAAARPAAILHVGIAGARRASGLVPPVLVIGRESLYCDVAETRVPRPGDDPSSGRKPGSIFAGFPPRSILASAELLEAVRAALPDASLRTIGTSARVGGTTGCDVEAMEGYAVLRAAQLAGVPAIEVRAIANEVEEFDRARWRFDEAFDAVVDVTPRLVSILASCVS